MFFLGDIITLNNKYYLKDRYIFNNFLVKEIPDDLYLRGYIDKRYMIKQLDKISKTNSKLIIILSNVNKKIYKILSESEKYMAPDIVFYYKKINKTVNVVEINITKEHINKHMLQNIDAE